MTPTLLAFGVGLMIGVFVGGFFLCLAVSAKAVDRFYGEE